jgi:ribA/ribD-fused uncharacterized protein
MKITEKHILFWGNWPSNFAWAPIKVTCVDGIERRFFSSEQYFMYEKAIHFGDTFTAEKILALEFNENFSYAAKKLGRQVKGFDSDQWQKVSYDIMLRGCLAKYSQNKVLFDKITAPEFEGKHFVEASPYDKIWGIGIGENEPDADDESKWKGKNWLGKVLDEVRTKLLNGYTSNLEYAE